MKMILDWAKYVEAELVSLVASSLVIKYFYAYIVKACSQEMTF